MDVKVELFGESLGADDEHWYATVFTSYGLFTDRWVGSTGTTSTMWGTWQNVRRLVDREMGAAGISQVVE